MNSAYGHIYQFVTHYFDGALDNNGLKCFLEMWKGILIFKGQFQNIYYSKVQINYCRNRSIVPSIKPKFDIQFFVDLQNNVRFEEHVNQPRIVIQFWLN